MERKKNEAGVRGSPIDAPTRPSGEIDLYDELTAFADLTPDEQLRLLNTATSPSASGSNSEDPGTPGEASEVGSEVFVRPSGPLGSLTKGFVFTGALSKGVCIACGAESGTDDLFCITCGVFIDEISSTRPVRLTCRECQQSISTDEIICPWCGSSLPEA